MEQNENFSSVNKELVSDDEKQIISQSEFDRRLDKFVNNERFLENQKTFLDKVELAMIRAEKSDEEIDERLAELGSDEHNKDYASKVILEKTIVLSDKDFLKYEEKINSRLQERAEARKRGVASS